jgi:hypothetical protein
VPYNLWAKAGVARRLFSAAARLMPARVWLRVRSDDLFKQANRIYMECFGIFAKFENVQLAFARFNFSHKRVGAPKSRGQFALRESSITPRRCKDGHQRLMQGCP